MKVSFRRKRRPCGPNSEKSAYGAIMGSFLLNVFNCGVGKDFGFRENDGIVAVACGRGSSDSVDSSTDSVDRFSNTTIKPFASVPIDSAFEY